MKLWKTVAPFCVAFLTFANIAHASVPGHSVRGGAADDPMREQFLGTKYSDYDENGWPLILKVIKDDPKLFEDILSYAERVLVNGDRTDPAVENLYSALHVTKKFDRSISQYMYDDPEVGKSVIVVAAQSGHANWVKRLAALDVPLHDNDMVFLAYFDLKDSALALLQSIRQSKQGFSKKEHQIFKEMRSWDALHWAAYRGDQELCEALVDKGWDPTKKEGSSFADGWDRFYMTKPAEVADKRKFKELAGWLREQEKTFKKQGS